MMPRPEGMEIFDRRLATFEVAHAVKRRASTAKKRTGTTLKWPHSTPDPEALAQAGFYYHPSSSSPDNCQCFVCAVNLDGWEIDDDPVVEHWSIKRDCPWAVVCYVRQQFRSDQNSIGQEDPMLDVYADARTATFRDVWPHEDKKGWKCKISKMVAAGWHYDPSPEDDDGVSCAYCNQALGGWERKDDPYKVHIERTPDCPFFQLDDIHKPLRKKTKKTRTSKASRASSQSNVSLHLDNVTLADLNETYMSTEAGEDDSVLTTTSITSKSTKGRKKATTTKKPAAKGRGKKTAIIEDSLIYEDENASAFPDEPLAPIKQTRRQVSRQVSAQVNTSTIESESNPKRTRTKKAAPVEEVIEELPQPKRGKKRTSSGVEKDNSMVSNVTIITAPKAKKASRTSKQAAKAPSAISGIESRIASVQKLDSSVMLLDEAPEIFEDPKPKRAKKAKKASSIRQPLKEIPVEDIQMSDDFPNLQSDMLFDASTSTPQQTPEASQGEGSPAPPSPTPAKRSLSGQKQATTQRITMTPKPAKLSASSAAKKLATPDMSPQSSDAENQPPSARPEIQGLQLNPISPMRIPLQSTPKQSPSKRNTNAVSQLRTNFAWSPADLEAVFLSVSPKKRTGTQPVLDKENFLPGNNRDLDLERLDKKNLADVVKAVRETMTDEERNMDVQQWLRFTAAKGGDILKAKCEEMVTLFERQGANGMRALEGIQVSR